MPITIRDLENARDTAAIAAKAEESFGSIGKSALKLSQQYTAGLDVSKAYAVHLNATERIGEIIRQSGMFDQWFQGVFEDASRLANSVVGTTLNGIIDQISTTVHVPDFTPTLDAIATAQAGSFGNILGSFEGTAGTMLGTQLADAVKRIEAHNAGIGWDDVVDAHAGFVATTHEVDDVVDLTEADEPRPARRPVSRGEAILIALTAMTFLVMFVAQQDDFVRNAGKNAELVERAISRLVEYIATLIVWAGQQTQA